MHPVRGPWTLLALAVAAPAHADADDPFGDRERTEDRAPACDDEVAPWWCVADDAALTERLDAARLWALGAGDGSQVVAASRALGAWLAPDGSLALGGATGAEHRWLIEGLPVDSLATGGPESRVPIAFLEHVDVATGGLGAASPAATGAVVDVRLRGPGDEPRVVRAWSAVAAPARPLAPVPDRFDPLTLDFDEPLAVGAIAAGGGRRGALWYYGGASLTLERIAATRIGHRLRDADGDGLYDRHADRTLVTEVVDRRARAPAFTGPLIALARAGHDGVADDVALTALVNYTPSLRLSADGTADATSVWRDTLVVDGLARYTARRGPTSLRVAAGWHRARRTDTPRAAGAAGAIQIATAYVPSAADVPEDAAFAAACDDAAADDPYPEVPNCPVPTGFYVRGGAGLLTDTASDRPVVTAAVTHAAGAHRLGAGVLAEDARYVITRRFSGGALERRLSEEIVLTTRFVALGDGDLDCGDAGPCRALAEDVRTYRTRHVAAWIEDAWQPAPGTTVTAGLRWESMEVGSSAHLRVQPAPRLAIVVDPTRRGAARVFAAWGRYRQLLLPGDAPALAGGPDLHTHLVTPFGENDSLARDPELALAPGLDAPRVDEALVGGEWALAGVFVAGASLRTRTTADALAEVAGQLVNPGTGGAAGTIAARRETAELAAWLGNAPTAPVHVRLGWIRTRQRGTWPGPSLDAPFDVTTGNVGGRLPLDLPHRFQAELITGGRVGPVDLVVGARLELASGTPIGARAGSAGEIALLPRGSVGRTPPTSAVITHVAARRGRFELAVDLIDVFDRRGAAAVDERWTLEEVGPIEGGSVHDLVWLKTVDGVPARRNLGYGAATVYRAPLVGRVSLSATF